MFTPIGYYAAAGAVVPFSDDLLAQYDATDASTVTLSGTDVTRWSPKVNEDNFPNLEPATSAYAQYTSSVALSFPASSNIFMQGDPSSITGNRNNGTGIGTVAMCYHDVAMVYPPTYKGFSWQFYQNSDKFPSMGNFINEGGSNNNYQIDRWVDGSQVGSSDRYTSYTPGDNIVIASYHKTNGFKSFYNGTKVMDDTTNFPSTSWDQGSLNEFSIMSDYRTNISFLKVGGRVYELLFWNKALSDSEATEVYNYLNDKHFS